MSKKTGRNTREQILQNALELFNESGSRSVSTNHIAAAMKISTGNLYYHFHNKEEIILDLCRKMFEQQQKIWAEKKGRGILLADVAEIFQHTFQINHQYRFFFHETLALLKNDTRLQLLVKSRWQQRKRNLIHLLKALENAGLAFLPAGRQKREQLLLAIELTSDNFLARSETLHQEELEFHIARGVAQVFYSFSVYLTEAGQERVLATLAEMFPRLFTET